MIRFNSYNYGSLFGSGSRSGYSNSILSNLSQLSSIRSGAYSKALKAYYGKNNTNATQKNNAVNKYNYSSYNGSVELSAVSKESSELVSAAKKLTATGKDSLFSDKEKYDADAAFKAASEFVTNYNETLNAVGKTTNTAVNNAASSMTRMTGVMTKSLGNIGVTIGKDGRMSINEEEFKNAGYDKVKSMLGTNGSFARIIGSSAQRLESAAEQQNRYSSINNGIYGKYGNTLSNYGYSGSSFNEWF